MLLYNNNISCLNDAANVTANVLSYFYLHIIVCDMLTLHSHPASIGPGSLNLVQFLLQQTSGNHEFLNLHFVPFHHIYQTISLDKATCWCAGGLSRSWGFEVAQEFLGHHGYMKWCNGSRLIRDPNRSLDMDRSADRSVSFCCTTRYMANHSVVVEGFHLLTKVVVHETIITCNWSLE